MKRWPPLFVTVVLPCLACGATRLACVSGDWAAPATWNNEAVPGDGDTVTITNGIAVTVSDARVVGMSGTNGTIAMHLNKSGSLAIAAGGLLRVRGDVVYTSGLQNTLPVVTVRAGGTWRWDASRAAAPQGTHYRLRPSGDSAFRPFVLAGTAKAHARLESDPAGGAGCFSLAGRTFGGAFQSEFGEIARIGDSTRPGWDLWWLPSAGSNNVWDVRDTAFAQCGVINFVNSAEGAAVLRHSRNVHVATQTQRVFTAISTSLASDRGVREITASVFDVQLAATAILGGCVIHGNYFGNGLRGLGVAGRWACCEDNFVRLAEGGVVSMSGTNFSDNVIFLDMQQDNPHVVFPPYKYTCDFDGLICSHAGAANMDSGEWLFGAGDFHVTRCILLPNAYGYSSGEMDAITGGFAGHLTFEHNTWFGGYGRQKSTYPGFSALQYSETGNSKPGDVRAFRDNILWNPQRPGREAAFVKMCDVHSLGADQRTGPPVQDVGDPGKIDFNDGWNCQPDAAIRFPNQVHYRNWGRGYIGNWSQTPGAHDLDADPRFVDAERDVPLFATKCLDEKSSRGEWSAMPEAPYAVGDTVLHATAIYWGLPVLYRYIGNGANPEPGAGNREIGDANAWRQCWEWASLHDLREGVRTQRRFDDGDIVMHLIHWIRAGYAPANPALKGAAHDGGDIGAVPCVPDPKLQ